MRDFLNRLANILFGKPYLVQDEKDAADVTRVEREIDERLERVREKAWARIYRET